MYVRACGGGGGCGAGGGGGDWLTASHREIGDHRVRPEI